MVLGLLWEVIIFTLFPFISESLRLSHVGVVNAPFPYVTRGPYGMAESKAWPAQDLGAGAYRYWGAAPVDVAARDTARCLDAMELILRTQCSPAETAAILVEPVLGEGGYIPCPPGYLKGLREICDR